MPRRRELAIADAGQTPAMKGRRSAALLCVLLVHALVFLALLSARPPAPRLLVEDVFVTEPITLSLEPIVEEAEQAEPVASIAAPARPRLPPKSVESAAPAAGVSTAVLPPTRVDWPLEGKKSAARVLAAEAEAERVARMFAGPDGTWASLTKRQRSKLSKFRWRPGVDGLEKDAAGNTIYHLSDGCVLVNFLFFGCSIGKPKVHDDMLENMRLYFDEQRLPQTNEGNGTEPGAQPLP